MLVHFGLAALAAVAVDDLLGVREADGVRAPNRTAWLVLVLLEIAACCAAVGLWQRSAQERSLPWARRSGLASTWSLLASAAGLVALAAHRPRLGFVGMVCLAIADQALYVLRLSIWEPGSVRTIAAALRGSAQPPHVSPELPSPLVTTPRPGNPQVPGVAAPCLPVQAFLAGRALTDGYMGLAPRRHLDFERDESLRLAGVEWAWDHRGGFCAPGARARCRGCGS